MSEKEWPVAQHLRFKDENGKSDHYHPSGEYAGQKVPSTVTLDDETAQEWLDKGWIRHPDAGAPANASAPANVGARKTRRRTTGDDAGEQNEEN